MCMDFAKWLNIGMDVYKSKWMSKWVVGSWHTGHCVMLFSKFAFGGPCPPFSRLSSWEPLNHFPRLFKPSIVWVRTHKNKHIPFTRHIKTTKSVIFNKD